MVTETNATKLNPYNSILQQHLCLSFHWWMVLVLGEKEKEIKNIVRIAMI